MAPAKPLNFLAKPPLANAYPYKRAEEEKEVVIDPIKAQVKELLESKPLTLELINASSLPEEIKGKLIQHLENGVKFPPKNPDKEAHTKPPLATAGPDKRAEEEKEVVIDPIKAQVKELLESKPLTLELINASSLPEEIKGKLIQHLENGVKFPPENPDKESITNLSTQELKFIGQSSTIQSADQIATDSDLMKFNDPITNPGMGIKTNNFNNNDIDFTGDGHIDHHDSLILMRHMMGTFPGESIMHGVQAISGPTILKQRLSKISNNSPLANGRNRFDVNGDKRINPFSDGIMISQHILNQGKNNYSMSADPLESKVQIMQNLTDLTGF